MALLLGLAMLPAGAIAMQVGLNAVQSRQAAIQESYGRYALQSISVERGVIDELRELLRVLATSPAIQRGGRAACESWLAQVRSEYAYVAAIAVTDENSHIVCSEPSAPSTVQLSSYSDLRQRTEARNDFTIGFSEHSTLTTGPVLAALAPLRDADNERTGFVGVSVSIEQLRYLLDRARTIQDARVAIVDHTGRIIAASEPDSSSAPLPDPALVRSHFGADLSFFEMSDGAAVVTPLHAPDLYAVMTWPSHRNGWQALTGVGLSIAAPLLIWLLAVAAGWFAIEIFVARPLSTVETMARQYARGEDVSDAGLVNAPAEIRSLRRTLAAMAKTLRGREARLMEALKEERALLREVHHRVKNNLQMVASLLNIQGRSARDESEAWGLARAHDRVQLLALVHQRIYSSGEVREVRLDELAADIARQLVQSRGPQGREVTLDLQLDPARCSADRAVPMAFLIGEGISAALDGVSEVGPSELRVYLKQEAGGSVRFGIDVRADGGVVQTQGSARLVDAFARQLGATLGRDPNRPHMIWAEVPPLVQTPDDGPGTDVQGQAPPARRAHEDAST